MGDKLSSDIEYFEIIYDRECEELVEAISETLHENMERIMDFFSWKSWTKRRSWLSIRRQ